MELKRNLKYKNGTFDYYHYGSVEEGGVTAQILIVPGEFFDFHMRHSIDFGMPVFAGCISKDHPEYNDLFREIFDPKQNLIFIRDEMFKIADKTELQSTIEHEFGHIFFGHTKEVLSRFDPDEILADSFIENLDAFDSLEKKWAILHHKKCGKCTADMIVDDISIGNHYFIYCPQCGTWVGDGRLNPVYIDCLVKERIGDMVNINYKSKFDPTLSYEEDRWLTGMITKAKLIEKSTI